MVQVVYFPPQLTMISVHDVMTIKTSISTNCPIYYSTLVMKHLFEWDVGYSHKSLHSFDMFKV